MSPLNTKKEANPAQVRVVVEVDGNPVGSLNLDIDRLWPLIHHRRENGAAIEWIEPTQFDSMMRAAVIKRLVGRLQERLYQTLGEEMVKAELDAESFMLKADAGAQAFGNSKADIEKLVAETGRTSADFYNFFWQYLVDDEREVTDLKKEWRTKDTPPR